MCLLCPLSWELFPGKETWFQGNPSPVSSSCKDVFLNWSISIQSSFAVGAALCIPMIKQNSSQHQHSQLDLKLWFKPFKNSLKHPLSLRFVSSFKWEKDKWMFPKTLNCLPHYWRKGVGWAWREGWKRMIYIKHNVPWCGLVCVWLCHWETWGMLLLERSRYRPAFPFKMSQLFGNAACIWLQPAEIWDHQTHPLWKINSAVFSWKE